MECQYQKVPTLLVMVKYIYPGKPSFLILHEFLEQLAKTPMRITELFNDRQSYFLTFRQWP